MSHPKHTFEIISDARRLGGLKREWDGLYDAQVAPPLSDSYDWASLSLGAVTSERKRRPYCIVVRRDGSVVALWPLVITPGPTLNIASPMNSESSEYCPFLLAAGEAPAVLWSAIREELRRRGDLDVLRLPHVRHDTPIHSLIHDLPESRAMIVQPAPMVRAGDFPAGEDYISWLPASVRANLRRVRRGLEQLGRVEFQEIASRAERTSALDWVLARKREWLQRRGLSNERLLSKNNTAFMAATLHHRWAAGSRRIFALKLDGVMVAAEMVSVDRQRVEAFTASYDPAFKKYAPGHLLTLEVIRWALAHGLDYDFRPGNEPYKRQWSNHVAPVTSYLLPVTFRGGLFVRYRMARRWLSQSTPRRLQAWISRLGSRKRASG